MFEEQFLTNYSKAELITIQNCFSTGEDDGANIGDEDIDTLQALIYSIIIGQPSVNRFFEIVDICTSLLVTSDLVNALLDSDDAGTNNNLVISENMYLQFFELFLEEKNLPPSLKERYHLRFITVALKNLSTSSLSLLPQKIPSSTVFVFHSSNDAGDNAERPLFYLKFYPSLNQIDGNTGENRKYVFHCINFDSFPFGVYTMELFNTDSTNDRLKDSTDTIMEVDSPVYDRSSSGSTTSKVGQLIHQESFLITSSLYDYVVSLDKFFDYFYWQFNSSFHYTPELEGILLELLVCIHDDFSVMINSMSSVLSLGGEQQQKGGYNPNSELQRYYSIILNDLQKALSEEHSGYAIGRLHQSFEQVLEMKAMTGSMFSGGGGMFNIPEHFQYKIQQYMEIKVNTVFKDDKKFMDLLSSLVRSCSVFSSPNDPFACVSRSFIHLFIFMFVLFLNFHR
jgi:hypothetical protein